MSDTINDLTIEEIIPHRGLMRLVENIIILDEDKAVTEATVSRKWPLLDGDAVDPMVLIELVAQTAGVFLGWDEMKKKGKDYRGSGWLVGIKDALFFLDRIPLNSRIITTAKRDFDFENYHEVVGKTELDSEIIGEIRIQVFKSDMD